MGYHTRDLDAFVQPLGNGLDHMDLAVEGVRCAGCMAKIEKGMGSIPGISRAHLNFTTKRLAVDWEEDALTAGDVVAKIEALGFKAYPFDPGRVAGEEDAHAKLLLRCLAVAGFAAANIMLLSVSVWSGNVSDIAPETRDLFHWISALIAIPAVGYAGRPFFSLAIAALKARSLNMDVPISLAVILAVGMSIAQTAQSAHHAYFDSAVMLLFFLLVGRYLEQNMRRRTRAQAENMAALRGEKATIMLPGGGTQAVPVTSVDPGALVLVAGGERLSVDGIIEEGRSEIDQSLVTGETVPATVAPGSRVYAGTLNMDGALRVRVTAAAEGTLLDDVNRLLETALEAKSKQLALADKAAQLYAPLVHGAAALTFIGWMIAGAGWQFSLLTAIAVLIITCPCALGLAIPAVQVVASGALFRSGVLLNAGDAIERLAEADTVVFDKTGTLTLPEPSVVNAGEIDPGALRLAGRLALSSRHPLAVALQGFAGDEAPLEGVEEEAGDGVSCSLEGGELRLGSAGFAGAGDKALQGAASVIWFRDGDSVPVPIRLAQALKEDAGEVVGQLRALGLKVAILSGDHAAAVAEVAEALGVERWRAGVKPAEKIALVEELKAKGCRTLMVGDGLNDAPALAAAHVSLSPVTAVHLSQAAADAIFLGERLAPFVAAITASRRARRIMTQNLWFSTAYNAVAVPIAVAGFVTPLIAALAMSGSSIVVTLNALRARMGMAQ